jgi:hypothetical protein
MKPTSVAWNTVYDEFSSNMIIVFHPTVLLISVTFADPHKGVIVPATYPADEEAIELEGQSRWHQHPSLNHLVLSAAE